MTTLLLNLKGALDPDAFSLSDFQALTNRLYQTKDKGFYVHAPPAELGSTDAIVKYVIRYIGRPVMAQSASPPMMARMLPTGICAMRTIAESRLPNMPDKDHRLNPNAPPIPDDGYDTLEESGASIVHYWIGDEVFTETEFAQLKREPYIQAPPEGYTADEIRTMSDDAILDMDYFLNE